MENLCRSGKQEGKKSFYVTNLIIYLEQITFFWREEDHDRGCDKVADAEPLKNTKNPQSFQFSTHSSCVHHKAKEEQQAGTLRKAVVIKFKSCVCTVSSQITYKDIQG